MLTQACARAAAIIGSLSETRRDGAAFICEGSFFRGRFTRALLSFLHYSVPGGIVNRNVEP